MITNYPEEDITKLKKYYARALKDPENRTVGTMSSSLRTSTSYLGTRISGKSLQIIEEQQKEIALLKRQKEMMELVIEEKEIGRATNREGKGNGIKETRFGSQKEER